MMRIVWLLSIDIARNQKRFYKMTLDPTMLFPVLIKEWGRIGRKKAKKLFVFTSSRLACREWDYTIKKRLQHGYRVLKKTNKD